MDARLDGYMAGHMHGCMGRNMDEQRKKKRELKVFGWKVDDALVWLSLFDACFLETESPITQLALTLYS